MLQVVCIDSKVTSFKKKIFFSVIIEDLIYFSRNYWNVHRNMAQLEFYTTFFERLSQETKTEGSKHILFKMIRVSK